MLGVAAIALFLSTITDSALGAALGALAVAGGQRRCWSRWTRPPPSRPTCRPGTGWPGSTSSASPSSGGTSSAGSAIQAVYVVVFLAAAWANFSTKDITA